MKVIRFDYYTKRDFGKKFGFGYMGDHDYIDGVHVISLPFGASTKTRLHELGHAKLGHGEGESPFITIHESAQMEIGATLWAYEKLGAKPHFGVLVDSLLPLIDEGFSRGFTVGNVFAWISDELLSVGCSMTQQEKSGVWWWLKKHCIKEKKRRKEGKVRL